jgi:hypothetical protein
VEKQHTYEKFILVLELVGFSAILAIIWLDEYVDVPFRYFGALKTPPRPSEYWFETLSVLLLATAVVSATLWVFSRLRFLENFIRVCAWCQKVEAGDEWVNFEQYMKREHDVKATHGICPECRANATKRPSLGESAPAELLSAGG